MIIIFKDQVDNDGIIKNVQIFSILTLVIPVSLQFIFNWQFFLISTSKKNYGLNIFPPQM